MATGTGARKTHKVKMLSCCEKVVTEGFAPGVTITLAEARRIVARNRKLYLSLRPLPSGHSRSDKSA